MEMEMEMEMECKKYGGIHGYRRPPKIFSDQGAFRRSMIWAKSQSTIPAKSLEVEIRGRDDDDSHSGDRRLARDTESGDRCYFFGVVDQRSLRIGSRWRFDSCTGGEDSGAVFGTEKESQAPELQRCNAKKTRVWLTRLQCIQGAEGFGLGVLFGVTRFP
ncbi:hypothetical protein U1Q18_044275 [Sarracenia purpurea var. burkii]